MLKSLYLLNRCLRCGDWPIYVVFYQDRRGNARHSVLLCHFSDIRRLLRKRRGFEQVSDFGKVLYDNASVEPNELLRDILKARYDFDLNADETNRHLLFTTA